VFPPAFGLLLSRFDFFFSSLSHVFGQAGWLVHLSLPLIPPFPRGRAPSISSGAGLSSVSPYPFDFCLLKLSSLFLRTSTLPQPDPPDSPLSPPRSSPARFFIFRPSFCPSSFMNRTPHGFVSMVPFSRPLSYLFFPTSRIVRLCIFFMRLQYSTI